MTREHQTKRLNNEPRGLSMARQLRIAIRAFVVLATISAFVCFIFKPELAHFAAFPIPVSILAFGILAGFERILRWFSEWRYRRRFGLEMSRESHQKSSKLITALKLLVALILGSLMIAAATFPTVALLLAVVSSRYCLVTWKWTKYLCGHSPSIL